MSTVNASSREERNLEEKICAFLKRQGAAVPLKALEIAKGVELERAKDVNKALYSLQRAGRLQKTAGSPPLWSLAEPCVSAVVPEVPNSRVTLSTHEIKTALSSHTRSGGVSAKKLARELKQPSSAVNAQLYDMLKRGEVEKNSSKDGSFLWKCSNEEGSKNNNKEESSDTQSDTVIWTSNESSDDCFHPPVSKFLEEFTSIESFDKGGFGKIYKAKQKLDEQNYAVKVVEYNEHALREVQALANFQHPNIVRYYTSWREPHCAPPRRRSSDEEDEDESSDICSKTKSSDEADESELSDICSKTNTPNDYVYIKMEFCDGGTLTQWIIRRNQKEDIRNKKETLDIFQKIVCGVEYIHSLGLIHRDLKPDNIFFGSAGAVKIGDFGLVTTIKDKNGASVERTKGKGTPSYMSPEQVNLGEYNEKVDIFPLGLIFFELLWRIGTGMERVKLWGDLRNGRPPKEFCSEYISEHALIGKMLSKAPEDRPRAEDISKHLILLIGSPTSSSDSKTV